MNRIVFAAIALFAFAPAARAADTLDAAIKGCGDCHGGAGASKDPTVPILWGQNAKYLEKQIRDFRSGDRDSQIMSSMAESIKRDDIAALSVALAGKDWPKRDAARAAAPASIAVCQGCHGAELTGGDSPEGAAPRLAGQFAEYLAAQMDEFARGQRANQKTMSAMMKAVKPEERAALAGYLAGL